MATLEIFDPNTGRLLASGNMAGFVCRKSGSGKTQARQGGNTNTSTILIDTSGMTYPIIALVTRGYDSAFYARYNGQINFATNGAVGSAFDYYIFDWTRALPDHNAPFMLFDTDAGDRVITFSSAYWPMKVVTAFNMAEAEPNRSYTAGDRLLAHAENNVGGHSRVNNGYFCFDRNSPSDPGDEIPPRCQDVRGRIDGKIYGAGTYDNGTRVTTSKVSVDDVTSTFGPYNSWQNSPYVQNGGWEVPNRVMVVDVTGIPVGRTFF